MSKPTTRLEYALEYASRGWPVIPLYAIVDGKCQCPKKYKLAKKCKPGKHPLGNFEHGIKDATTDAQKIRMWWGPTMWPDANIGIALDAARLLDIAPDSVEDHAAFIAAGLPETLTFRSGGGDGHQHYLYALPEGVPQIRLCRRDRFDILTAGYCVAPPSVHESGGVYEWDIFDARMPSAPPAWACDLLVDELEGRTVEVPVAASSGEAILGQNGQPPLDIDARVWAGLDAKDRSSGLYAIAGELADAGANEATIVEALRQQDEALGWNKYTNRRDGELRYVEIARRQLANAMPRITLNGRVHVAVDDQDDAEADVETATRIGTIPEFPLEVLPPLLQRLIERSSLPNNLLAGAYLGALAAACGGRVRVYHETFGERLILFIALVGLTGAGKSPSLSVAWAPLEAWDAARFDTYRDELRIWRERTPQQKKDDKANGIQPPRDPTVLFRLATPEAVYRRLDQQSALGLLYDELASYLKGLSRYRNRGDEDSDSALTMWEGAPLRYTRVGQGGGSGNAVDIFVREPTVTVCGGLQPSRQHLLGADMEGLRPRWLIFMHEGAAGGDIVLPDADDLAAYDRLVTTLLQQRTLARQWLLDGAAWRRLNEFGEQWAARARLDGGTPSMLAALPKAPRMLARIAGVLAEADRGLRDGQVDPESEQTLSAAVLERAARIVDYTLEAWDALAGGVPFALHPRIERVDQAIGKVLEYLQRRGGGPINSDLLRRNNVAGIETRADLDVVLQRYEARFPGTVTQARDGEAQGRRRRDIRSPQRGG